VLEVVKVVRTCQNPLGQDGTRLGLLLLHVGPNSDGFGGQAFMEHYNGSLGRLTNQIFHQACHSHTRVMI
jgi:hypothetical protein